MMREREPTRVGRKARGAAALVAAVCASSVSYWLRLLLVLATAALLVLVCLPDAASLGAAAAAERPVFVDAAVSFPEHVLLLLNSTLFHEEEAGGGESNNPRKLLYGDHQQEELVMCIYGAHVRTKVLAIDQGFVRCEHPSSKTLKASLVGKFVSLQIQRLTTRQLPSEAQYGAISWKKVVYQIVAYEEEGFVLLFAKGIVVTKKGEAPQGLECVFGNTFRTQVTESCQENFRCPLPPPQQRDSFVGLLVHLQLANGTRFPSVVRYSRNITIIRDNLHNSSSNKAAVADDFTKQTSVSDIKTAADFERHSLEDLEKSKKDMTVCACTMIWNGAKFLREWVMFHDRMGVERFFLYDNNSDDDLDSVVKSLQSSNFNLSRHVWPWLKTQEAGFSHCASQAMPICEWVAFIDLDEFLFPSSYMKGLNQQSNNSIVEGKMGQLKIPCYTFGASGLVALPSSGQIVNYICRMRAPKRVKSIVRLVALSPTLCSQVHHFHLRSTFQEVRANIGQAAVYHYKYQVWEDFKTKFVHRVATFVPDWSDNYKLNHVDRTPGLGTKAVEPPAWAEKFCELNDTTLRDFALSQFQRNKSSSELIWESHASRS
ncbi:unnamed protein product [Sphagnum troendelagicum]|uniref:Glycosyltransferase family 92 protein n=1 Tax=Sphagnum troendelagicum TaxID=128251 RepID=A0ABP0UJR8_9BRYO